MTPPTARTADADLDALLEPLAQGAGAGRELDGTLELSAFEMSVREPEAAPIAGVDWQDERDWAAISVDALALLQTSKDLRVAVQLARGRLETGGLPAFCQALCFVCELTRRHWPSVYPRLDGDEPTARVNALEELASPPVQNQLRRARLAVAPGLGPVSVKDALGSVSAVSQDLSSHVKAALDALGASAVEQHLAQLRAARAALGELRAFVLETSGASLRLKPLLAASDQRPGALDTLEALFAAAHERLSGRPDDGPEPARPAGAAPAASPPRSGAITSRDDVIATLDRVCAYYSASEPSSPVPLLLRRAQRLVPLDFLSLVRDLARDGLGDIAKIAGVDRGLIPEHAEQPSPADLDGE